METLGINILWGVIKVLLVLLPIPLAFFALKMWLYYIRRDFIFRKLQYSIIEVRIPSDSFKSLLAMEAVITNAFYQKSGLSPWEIYWDGEVTKWYSLEIVSIEGNIHFLIRVPTPDIPFVKSQIYSQYPGASISNFDDYVYNIPDISKERNWDLWGTEWKLANNDSLPLKSYIDYGLDKSSKDSGLFIDPLSALIESMTQIGPKEHMWVQYIIRPSVRKWEDRDFTKECLTQIEELKKPFTIEKKDDKGNVISKEIRVPEDVSAKIKLIQNKMQKVPFDCGIRVLYAGEKSVFVSAKTSALKNMFRFTTNPMSNELVRANTTSPDAPIMDPMGDTLLGKKTYILRAYRMRDFFEPNFKDREDYFFPFGKIFSGTTVTPITLSSEELATLYHFPTLITENPGIKKVETKSAKAPVNLPF
jgi:hypothetical protein